MEYFYQDFLFTDVPLDNNEMPSLKIDVVHSDKIPLPIEGPFPFEESCFLKFSSLLQISLKEEWIALLDKYAKCHLIYLIDDVPIANEEVAPFKEMFIKTYYWHLSNHCCRVLLVVS